MVADFLPGNRITLLDSGAQYFPALLAEIDGAQSEIFLESYIFYTFGQAGSSQSLSDFHFACQVILTICIGFVV